MPPRISRSAKQARGTLRPGRESKRPAELPTATRPPRPPKDWPEPARAIWLELAAAVTASGTYSAPFAVAFRQLVLAVADAENPSPDLPPSVRQKSQQLAASWLARWGLDPSSVARAEKAPKAKVRDELDEFT